MMAHEQILRAAEGHEKPRAVPQTGWDKRFDARFDARFRELVGEDSPYLAARST